jgi:hypothetical protein
MPRELYPSSYECDCGHQSHFAENTIREARTKSRKREIHLGDSEIDEHTIIFFKEEAVRLICPEKGRLTFCEQENGQARGARTFKHPAGQKLRPGDKVVWFKSIPGGPYVYPVSAIVRAVTAKRIKIEADDDGQRVIRYVQAESLQRRE